MINITLSGATLRRGRGRGGLVTSTLDSWLRGLDSRPGWVNCVFSCAKYLTFTVPLSNQEYKWVYANNQGSLMKCLGEGGGGEGRATLL